MSPMICPSCSKPNQPENLFCVECGSRLELVCDICGAQIDVTESFCGVCGQPTRAEGVGRSVKNGPREAWAERRQLTVLFSDVVGSAELSERLELEDFHNLIRAYDEAVSNVISRFGGKVAQYLGDGVLAYFGWPRAQGDDAERAVRAGLDILAAVAGLNRTLQEHQQIAARVGIHTGPVVIGYHGSGPRRDTSPLGGTPIVAARVQAVAPNGSVVITEATQSLVAGLFIVEALGQPPLKGISEPIAIYRVHQAAGVRARLKGVRKLTSFVGRESELHTLHQCWQAIETGQKQVAHLTGEPGIGKSRLVQQFRETIGTQAHTWLECFCSPFTRNTPFAPVTNLLEAALAWRGDESIDERLGALETGLRHAGLRLDESLPLLAEMLSIPLPAPYRQLLLAPEHKRERLLTTLTQWVIALAHRQPLVIVVEDLQWADPSTLELLGGFIGLEQATRALLISSSRPDFRPPWVKRGDCVDLRLRRLPRADALSLAQNLSADSPLDDKTLDLILDRTEGVPLFIEEIARIAAVTGSSGISARQIPSTLADSLMARIDRLGKAREIAQIASVVGREFSYAMLRQIANKPEEELRRALAELIASGLIRAAGVIPEAVYLFDHALIRDAAYGSLLNSRLQNLHHEVAHVLTTKFPQQVEAEPEVLAHHLTQANEIDPAVEAWQRAGDRGVGRGAFVEASNHYGNAIELLERLSSSSAREQRQIALVMAMGSALSAAKGLASDDAERAFARARELAARMHGDRASILLGVWQTHIARGQMTAAAAMAEQSLAAARHDGTALRLSWANYAKGATEFHRGNIASGIRHLSEAVKQSGQEGPSPRPFDVGPLSMSYLAVAMLLAGFPDQAHKLAIRCLELARELAKPSNIAFCSVNVAAMYQLSREPQSVLRIAREAGEQARLRGLGQFPSALEVYTGWAVAALGNPQEGVEQIRHGISGWLAQGQRLPHAWYLALLAWAYALAERYEQAHEILNDASAAIGEQFFDQSIVAWTRADILVRARAPADVIEQAWREALAPARNMGVKLYELRGAVGLCRVLQRQGRKREGHDLLSQLYAWFNEGFDSSDVKEAKLLLDEIRLEEP